VRADPAGTHAGSTRTRPLRRVVARRLARNSRSAVEIIGTPDIRSVVIDGEQAVPVTLRGEVELVFARGVPGAPDTMQVTATATAVARRR